MTTSVTPRVCLSLAAVVWLVATPAAGQSVTATIPVGGHPLGVAVDLQANVAYISHETENAIVAIDAFSDRVFVTLPVGANPYGVAVHAPARRVYVTNYGTSNSLSVIDVVTHTVIGNIAVGGGPISVGLIPAKNRVYVSNYRTNTVSVIDAVAQQVIATVPVGIQPYGLDVNASTNRIYVANYASGTMTVIDGETNTAAAEISLGCTKPIGVGVNAVTNKTYVACSDTNSVVAIDGGTNTGIATLATGTNPYGVAVNSRNNRVYVTSSVANTVSVIDGATDTIVASLPVGRGPLGIGVNANTRRVFVANYLDGTITTIQDIANTVDPPPTVVNVTDFGAVGDGTTNNQTAFVRAIAAADMNSLPVFIPAGTYILSGPLVIPPRMSLRGDNNTKHGNDGATLKFLAGTTGDMLILQHVSSVPPRAGHKVSDLTLIGSDDPNSTGIVGSRYEEISRVTIRHFRNGIRLADISNVLEKVVIKHQVAGGVGIELGTVSSAANDVTVRDTYIAGTDPAVDIGIRVFGGAAVRLQNNNLGNQKYAVDIEGPCLCEITATYAETVNGAFVYVNNNNAQVQIDGNHFNNAGNPITTAFGIDINAGNVAMSHNNIQSSSTLAGAIHVATANSFLHYGVNNRVSNASGGGVRLAIIANEAIRNVTSTRTHVFTYRWNAAAPALVPVTVPTSALTSQVVFKRLEIYCLSGPSGTPTVAVGLRRPSMTNPEYFAATQPIFTGANEMTVVGTWTQSARYADKTSDALWYVTLNPGTSGGDFMMTLEMVELVSD